MANPQLRRLVTEAHWTLEAFARAVNTIGAESGLSLRYDRTAAAHWLSGTQPRGGASALVAEALSRRLHRVIRPEEAGLVSAGAEVPTAGRVDAVATLVTLAHADLDPARHGRPGREIYRVATNSTVDWVGADHDLPAPVSAGPNALRVGPGQVDAAALMTRAFLVAVRQFGGRHARTALVTYLERDIADWLRADGPVLVRRQLWAAATDLTALAGFMTFDDNAQGLAQRYYQVALALAAHADDPARYAVCLRLLSDQAVQLGNRGFALALATSALATTEGRAPPSIEALLHTQAAIGHAAFGRADAAYQHLHRADHYLRRSADPPPLIGACDRAILATCRARVRTLLGDRIGAIAALHTALRQYPATERHARTLTLAALAERNLDGGHIEFACAAWRRFLDAYPYLRSARADIALLTLHRRLDPIRQYPAVDRVLREAASVHPTASDIREYQQYASTSAAGTRSSGHRDRRPGPLAAPYARVLADYRTALCTSVTRRPATVRAYVSRVHGFLAWLGTARLAGDPLAEPDARDRAVAGYHAWLAARGNRKAITLNAHLTALDDFYRWRGLGPTAAPRRKIPRSAPHRPDPHIRWLRAAERAAPRDRALAYTRCYARMSGTETVALDVDDVRLGNGRGQLIVRHQAKDTRRTVPLHPRLRIALEDWLADRATFPGAGDNPALFLNRGGDRLSVRGADSILGDIAARGDRRR